MALQRIISTILHRHKYDMFKNDKHATEKNLSVSTGKYETFAKNGKNEKEEVTYTIQECIDHIGMGKFHVKMTLLVWLAVIGCSMQVMLLSMLGPSMGCDWQLSPSQEAFLTTSFFIGKAIGSPILGKMADNIGRRVMLFFCAAWGLYFSILSGMAPEYYWLTILRAITGFGVPGIYGAYTYYAEFLPVRNRGRLMMLIDIAWAAGGIIEVLLGMLLIRGAGWRWWLVISALPFGLYMFATIFLPESPRFLLARGKTAEARQILEGIASENGCYLMTGSLVYHKPVIEKGSLRDLIKTKCRAKTTALLMVIYCLGAFAYYGMAISVTQLLSRDDPMQSGTSTVKCQLDCDPLEMKHFIDILWTSTAELASIASNVILMDWIGRKKSMALMYGLFSVSCFLLIMNISPNSHVTLLFLARTTGSAAYLTMFIYIVEVYPTEIRAQATGLLASVAQAGTILTPFVAVVFLQHSVNLGLGIYTASGLIASIASLCLPVESSGRSLEELEE